MTLNSVIGWILGAAALVFVLLLAGFASGALTEDPPAVNPYAARSSDDSNDVFDTDAYDAGSDLAASEATTAGDQVGTAITIEDFDFGEPITVAVGQAIAVTNLDRVGHTWTSRDGVFDSGFIDAEGSFDYGFEQPGEYEFFCTIHPSMTGSITVTG